MREMIKNTLPLFIICFVVALCLAFVNSSTKSVIEERNKKDAEEQRRQVMNAAKSFKEVEDWKEKDQSGMIREVYAGYDGDKVVGYVFSVYPKGYGGEINVTVGVGIDKRISDVRIGENSETPGLGTKVSEEGFYRQYSQKDIDKTFTVVKQNPSRENEIQAISGATISSKAVTSAIQASADLGKVLLENGGSSK